MDLIFQNTEDENKAWMQFREKLDLPSLITEDYALIRTAFISGMRVVKD